MKITKSADTRTKAAATYEGGAGYQAASRSARALAAGDSSFVTLWAAMGLCWLLFALFR